METKLTLKLDTRSISRAKKYVRAHRGRSLSKLVENYFNHLTQDEPTQEKKVPPIVASLAGVAQRSKIRDIKKEYARYLARKYK